jgi:hypothetical protein
VKITNILILCSTFTSFAQTTKNEASVKHAQEVMANDIHKARKKFLSTISNSMGLCNGVDILKLDKTNDKRSDVYLPFDKRWVSAKGLTKGLHKKLTKNIKSDFAEVFSAVIPQIGPPEAVLRNDQMEPDFEIILKFEDVNIEVFVDTGSKNITICYDFFNSDIFYMGALKQWEFLSGLLSKAE